MSLTLAGRLFHSAGAAIWNDLSHRVFFHTLAKDFFNDVIIVVIMMIMKLVMMMMMMMIMMLNAVAKVISPVKMLYSSLLGQGN